MMYLALFASLLGLCVSWYLYRKKRTKTKMICPLRANCEKVIHSTHARTLGIPNEILGIAYYVLVGELYSLIVLIPTIFATPLVFGIIAVLTLIGVLFTLYLILIQVSILHAWCSWCLLSAIAVTILTVCMFMLDFI